MKRPLSRDTHAWVVAAWVIVAIVALILFASASSVSVVPLEGASGPPGPSVL